MGKVTDVSVRVLIAGVPQCEQCSGIYYQHTTCVTIMTDTTITNQGKASAYLERCTEDWQFVASVVSAAESAVSTLRVQLQAGSQVPMTRRKPLLVLSAPV